MTIVSVTPKWDRKGGWWLIKASDGEKYATRDMFAASVAERAQQIGANVKLLSSSGWNYRNLSLITILETPRRGADTSVRQPETCVEPSTGDGSADFPKGAA